MTASDDVNFLSLENELTAYALEQAHPLVKAWRGDHLAADMRQATVAFVALMTDDEGARRFAETMTVLALPPELFKARLVEIDGHRLLAQIDFPDPSARLPFVAVLCASTPPGTIPNMSILRHLAEEFAIFLPRRVQFYHPAHLPLTASAVFVDQHFLASPAGEIAARPSAPGLTRVTLQRPADLRFYPRYVEAYNQMFSARPELRGFVCIEREATLAECRAEGNLYEIAVDGVWAGVIAARRQVVAGLRGIYMVDILLDHTARGQGLGPAVHQRLALKVASVDPSAILTGTIASVNKPSLKTATRAGRIEIGAWCWFDL